MHISWRTWSQLSDIGRCGVRWSLGTSQVSCIRLRTRDAENIEIRVTYVEWGAEYDFWENLMQTFVQTSPRRVLGRVRMVRIKVRAKVGEHQSATENRGLGVHDASQSPEGTGSLLV